MSEQIKHTLDQVERFGKLLHGKTNQEIIQEGLLERLAQLGFNLGRYVELVNADGRAAWGILAKCIGGDYEPIIEYVKAEKIKNGI